MDSVLLDTDVFSLFYRRDTRSLLYDDDVRGKVRCLSFATVAELRFGLLRRERSQRCLRFQRLLRGLGIGGGAFIVGECRLG